MSKRVLIVDDDPRQLDALTELVSGAGYSAIACRDFEDAYRHVRSEEFQAIVTDVRLGAFNGLQLALFASVNSPTIKRIAISGFDDPALRALAARYGTTFFLKPIDPSALLREISSPAPAGS